MATVSIVAEVLGVGGDEKGQLCSGEQQCMRVVKSWLNLGST